MVNLNKNVEIKPKVTGFVANEYASEGLQKLENINKDIVPLDLSELANKLQITYDKNSDVIIVNCDSNLLIKAENNIFISKQDTVILTGDELGISKGKLLLNPKFLFNKIKTLFQS